MGRYDTGIRLGQVGVVSGFDMTTESAITKLMYLLGKGLSPQEVGVEMRISICGELTQN